MTITRNQERLLDIQDAIDKIQGSLKQRPFPQLTELEQYGVVYLLQIIGEASQSLSADFRDQYSHLPWQQIIGFRNFVVHQDVDVDQDIICSVVQNDLPILKQQIEDLLPAVL